MEADKGDYFSLICNNILRLIPDKLDSIVLTMTKFCERV